jgi:hypothetical protein
MSRTGKILFEPGLLVGTPGCLEAFRQSGESLYDYFMRHRTGDWGELSDGDKQANDRAVKDGSRILSAYMLKSGVKVWVITKAVNDDGFRESTCFLLPEEY